MTTETTAGTTSSPDLLSAALALSRERDEDAILASILDAAMTITNASFAALAGYETQTGEISRFSHRGVPEVALDRIGHLPAGHGLLAAVGCGRGPLRVEDLTGDPRFGGLPVGHSPMGAFLGVPVRSGGRTHGNLYVARSPGAPAFEEADEQTLVTLAAFAACAIDGARLVVAERERGAALAASAASQARERQRTEALGLVIAAQEDERARVARDLHDEVGQALTGVLLGLHLVDTAVRARPVDADRAAERTADVRQLVAEALGQVRRLAADLRPTVLDDLGLAAALQRLVSDVGGRLGVGVDLELGSVERRGRLPGPVETVVYRVVQESLTNVVRHAHAQHVTVHVVASPTQLLATISDDGVGFDPAVARGSLGLLGMSERAGLAGGSLNLRSRVGQGTSVYLHLPLHGQL
jgi:signal transduction histidine kinase